MEFKLRMFTFIFVVFRFSFKVWIGFNFKDVTWVSYKTNESVLKHIAVVVALSILEMCNYYISSAVKFTFKIDTCDRW